MLGIYKRPGAFAWLMLSSTLAPTLGPTLGGMLTDAYGWPSIFFINAAAIRALAEFGIQARPEDFEPFVGAGEDRYVGGVAEIWLMPEQLRMA